MARLELFCSLCGRINLEQKKEIFQRAGYFVEETGFDYYPDLNQRDTKEANEYGKNL